MNAPNLNKTRPLADGNDVLGRVASYALQCVPFQMGGVRDAVQVADVSTAQDLEFDSRTFEARFFRQVGTSLKLWTVAVVELESGVLRVLCVGSYRWSSEAEGYYLTPRATAKMDELPSFEIDDSGFLTAEYC